MLHLLELLLIIYVLITRVLWELSMHWFSGSGFIHHFCFSFSCILLQSLGFCVAVIECSLLTSSVCPASRRYFLASLHIEWRALGPNASVMLGSGCHPSVSCSSGFQPWYPLYSFSRFISPLSPFGMLGRSCHHLLSLHVCYSCRAVSWLTCLGLGSHLVSSI